MNQSIASDSKANKEQNRIHMLYKGKLQSDVEKQKNISIYQLNKARQDVEKHTVGVHELKL